MSLSSSDISILPLTTGKYTEDNTLNKVVNKCKAVAVTSKSSILANDCIASRQLYRRKEFRVVFQSRKYNA